MSEKRQEREPMIDFVTTTGKNVGKIKNTELGIALGLGEGAMRNIEKKHPQRYEMMYFGALCEANKITKDELIKIINDRNAK